MKELSGILYDSAKKHHPCSRFSGKESFDELMRLFTSVQGIEFCMAKHWPDAEALKLFDGKDMSQWGVYLNQGSGMVENKPVVVLIGNCDYIVKVNTLEHPCKLVLMRGAKADIYVEKYAVLRIVADASCQYNVIRRNHSVVTYELY